jgi:hypothetical protein
MFALLQGRLEIEPKKIHDPSYRKARNPSGGNISKPNVNENNHCEQHGSCERFVPQGGPVFSHRGHS